MDILHIVPGICYGGIEQVILRYTKLSQQTHHVLTLSSKYSSQLNVFNDKFSSVTLNESSNPIGKYLFILKFCRNKEFDVIHLHLNEMSGLVYSLLKLIKKKNKIVVHSHNFYREYQETLYIRLNKQYTKFITEKSTCLKFACTEEAGRWLFKDNYRLIKNAFELSGFSSTSDIYKNRMSFIARLEQQKQPLLALAIYKEHFKEKYQMQFIGNGSLKEALVSSISPSCNITVSDPEVDVSKLLFNTDILLAPSAYEGLGIIVLEAYCSGCIVIVSQGYPEDVLTLPGIIILDKENKLSSNQIEQIKIMEIKSRIARSKENQCYLKSIGYDIEGKVFDDYY